MQMSSDSRHLKLKVIWRPKFLGLAIDQLVVINSYSCFCRPLTTYYFWPKSGVWEQLKLELDSAMWLTEKEKIRYLNLVSDIINEWQKYKDIGKIEDIKKKFSEVSFLELRE
tara:strand:- start:210 stop:545 length:336 start_codon:yes stop_codon:yes gene_type:complete